MQASPVERRMDAGDPGFKRSGKYLLVRNIVQNTTVFHEMLFVKYLPYLGSNVNLTSTADIRPAKRTYLRNE